MNEYHEGYTVTQKVYVVRYVDEDGSMKEVPTPFTWEADAKSVMMIILKNGRPAWISMKEIEWVDDNIPF
tara:strand:- start:367 stop:576 length:210 start_codon:yes stop_codon:yes gene_type:complete